VTETGEDVKGILSLPRRWKVRAAAWDNRYFQCVNATACSTAILW